MEQEFVKDLVSVIIPCYNVAPYIKRCLDSIFNNTYNKLEVICIDDGSSDNTLEVLQKETDERLIIISQKNQGVSVARNAGLEATHGEFISFIDPDDWTHKDFFKRMVDAQKQSGADVVICDYLRVEGFVRDKEMNAPVSHVLYKGTDAWTKTSFKNYIWRKLYKRSYVADSQFLVGAKIGEDLLYNVDTFVNNPQASYAMIDDKLLYYYNRPGSLIRTFTGEDLLPIVDGMFKATSRCSAGLSVLLSTEVFKLCLAVRYLSMFDSNYKEVNDACASYFSLSLKNMKGKVSFIEYFRDSLLVKYPFMYRVSRIITDCTLLEWERNQKNKHTK